MSSVPRDVLSSSVAHAINDPLAALIANLELVAEALDGEPTRLAARVDDAREPLREARESAERIHSIVRPLHAASTAPASRRDFPAREPITASRKMRTKILVVDDDVLTGRALVRSLHGYEVVVLRDAREALRRILSGERFALVLCDLMMPDLTGMDLYDEVVRLAPEQARSFVFLSGGAFTLRASDFVRAVPNRVLTKPFDVQRLRELVRERERRSDRVVLVVDDDEETRKLVVQWLTHAGFTCIEQASGRAALEALVGDPEGVDAIVLDVMMPELDGFEVLSQLRVNPGTAHIPIVLLTAQALGEAEVARGIDAGASFYLTKPFRGPVVVSCVRAACERSDADREVQTRLRFAEEHATTDGLTGLMNRRAFDGRLAEALANAGRHREPLALVMLDLDHFKRINDTFGHAAGDRVLLYFARALRRTLRVGDQPFRYGGEEFAVLLPRCDAEGALRVAERVQRDLRERPLSLVEGTPHVVRFSAGIAAAEAANGFRVDTLVARADAALYAAKERGRDRVVVSAAPG